LFAVEFPFNFLKILLLNQTFYPDVMATGQYLTELAVALAERGHEVTVVTGRRAYDNPEKLFPARETWRGVQIFRVLSTCFGKRTRWRRAADFASFIVSSCLRQLFLPRQDIVVALTTPPLISFIGVWRAKLWRARFCYWVMDLNPDEAIAAGWLRADSFVAKLLERMSRFSFRRADRIIALDRFMRDRILAKGIPPAKIAVIPPWSHDSEVCFDAAGRERFRKTHGLDGKFVVMYSGNHSPVHPLDTLMQVADRLKEDPGIVFCFIGGGSEFVRVKQWASATGNPRVVCLPYQPLDQLSTSISAADLHVVVLGEAMLGIVHPCKIYNILAVGAPVLFIGPQPSHVTEILDELGPEYPKIQVAHRAEDDLARQIQTLRQKVANTPRSIPGQAAASFAKDALLPQMIKLLENGPSN
jgi:glycosyltransferase involved in cell wall biosynthesis